jgi:hypothetical protein
MCWRSASASNQWPGVSAVAAVCFLVCGVSHLLLGGGGGWAGYITSAVLVVAAVVAAAAAAMVVAVGEEEEVVEEKEDEDEDEEPTLPVEAAPCPAPLTGHGAVSSSPVACGACQCFCWQCSCGEEFTTFEEPEGAVGLAEARPMVQREMAEPIRGFGFACWRWLW